jgi:hypothetical protein
MSQAIEDDSAKDQITNEALEMIKYVSASSNGN